jgi:hypothetical protein
MQPDPDPQHCLQTGQFLHPDPDPICHPDADPDSDFSFDANPNADPDQTFHPDPDPDPDPNFKNKAPTLEMRIHNTAIYLLNSLSSLLYLLTYYQNPRRLDGCLRPWI